MVDFFGGKVDVDVLVFLALEQSFVVVEFSWEGDAADDFDLSAFIDEYVFGVDASYLLL
jgi:hypothetical protein